MVVITIGQDDSFGGNFRTYDNLFIMIMNYN